ncbi:hypothetical protein BJV77DRAFT_1161344 [Russula vinacea]|nr:hypothetical protein BJV77DRAFT_1161344 [Russula vinacea]
MEDVRLREHAYDFGGWQDLLKLEADNTSALLLLKTDQLLLHHADVDFTTSLLARRGDTGPPCVARLGSGG